MLSMYFTLSPSLSYNDGCLFYEYGRVSKKQFNQSKLFWVNLKIARFVICDYSHMELS